MYIIIGGGGKIGYYLAKALLGEGHEVLVIEKDSKRYNVISEELGPASFRGDACEATTLQEVGTNRADLVIAVTGDDEDNLVICQVAKQKFNVGRTIARISNPRNEAIFHKLGIDVTVSSTEHILNLIEEEIPGHFMHHLRRLQNAGLDIVEVEIPRRSPSVGKSLLQLRQNGTILDATVALITRGDAPIIPGPDTVLQEGDSVLVLVKTENSARFLKSLTG